MEKTLHGVIDNLSFQRFSPIELKGQFYENFDPFTCYMTPTQLDPILMVNWTGPNINISSSPPPFFLGGGGVGGGHEHEFLRMVFSHLTDRDKLDPTYDSRFPQLRYENFREMEPTRESEGGKTGNNPEATL